MSFGMTIKKLRRNRDMTQEELAELLSISPQAVSRWETDITMPDIALLPAICNLFGVTSDSLLGIDVAKKGEQLKQLRDSSFALYSRGYLDEAAAVLENGLKLYPDDYALMSDLMYVMSWRGGRASDKEEKKAFDREVIRLGEKILEGCIDNSIRSGAVQCLCFLYPECGKRDRAVELAKSMPSIAVSLECLLSAVETGTACHEAKMRENFTLLQFLERNLANFNCKLDSGEPAYTKEEMARKKEKVIALMDILFENGDYGFYNDLLLEIHSYLARHYLGSDSQKALYHIGKAAECAVAFIEYISNPNFKYTSLVFRDMDAGTTMTMNSKNSAKRVLDDMRKTEFDTIRDAPAFAAAAEKLEVYAGNWEA